MTREHDAIRDLLAPVALRAADPAEIARVETHAAQCAVCREELAGLRAGAAVLALAVPQRDPSPRLKQSLMATVRAEAGGRQEAAMQAGAPVAPARRRGLGERLRSALPIRPWPALATVGAIAALLLGWNIALQTTSDPASDDVAALAVRGTSDAPGVTGRVVYVPDEDTAVVRLAGLPPLEEGDAYQLWVLRDGNARSAGLFEPTAPAQAVKVADDLAGADALAVTAQPSSNRTAPEGPILVQAPLSG